MLKLEHIAKSFGETHALNDVSLHVLHKAFIVLAGPSGCGKTTLLNCIAGFLKHDGNVLLNACDITSLPIEKREIAMVFQDAALFPHLSVFDNIAFGLHEIENSKEKVEEMASLVGIADLLKRRTQTLSNGQKQRVSIARALVRNPKLFLMDEPLSALDARLKSQLRIEIAMLYQKMDATFLYVTHDQMEAMTMADYLIVMKDGAISQMDRPMEIYQNPANLFVATFLGRYEINQFHGVISKQQLHFGNRRFTLENAICDQPVIIAVRPEYIYKEDTSEEVGEIALIEHLGDDVYYHLAWKQQMIMMKGNLKDHYQIKDIVPFMFHFQDAFYFDKESGERIYI